MNNVIEKVQSNKRMRRFAATYALIYLVISLILNYLGTLLDLSVPPMSYLFSLMYAVLQAPFIYGFVRGVLIKDYSISKGLSAYFEIKNYPTYLIYILLNLSYEVIDSLVDMLRASDGAMGTVGNVISAVMILLKIILNFYIIVLYFGKIYADENDGKMSLPRIFRDFFKILIRKPGKILAAEIFMIVFNFASMYLALVIVAFLPENDIIKLLFTCLTSVQFGLITWTWPIYYLYYKDICDSIEDLD